MFDWLFGKTEYEIKKFYCWDCGDLLPEDLEHFICDKCREYLNLQEQHAQELQKIKNNKFKTKRDKFIKKYRDNTGDKI